MKVNQALARLEMLAPSVTMRASAAHFCREFIRVVADLCCSKMNSVYLVSADGKHLVLQAAVGLPEPFVERIRKLPLDVSNPTSPCAQAVALKKVVVAEDFSHPLLLPLREAAVEAGIASMWSYPLVREDGQVIGTLATYYTQRRIPTPMEVERVRRVVGLSVCILDSYNTIADITQQPDPVGILTPLHRGTLRALLLALELRDYETIAHSRRVVTYTLLLAGKLRLDGGIIDAMALGAALHDVGKLGISDTILRKPGRLTDAEFEKVKAHPTIGYDMLRHSLCGAPSVLQSVLYHHERFDGSGYPDGLLGEQIPLPARILSVADAFDVMTTERPYSPARSVANARAEIFACRGTQFCPRCVEAFMDIAPDTLEDVRMGHLDLSSLAGLFRDDWGADLAATVGF